MRDLEPFDKDGVLDQIAKNQRKKFDKLFAEKYRAIDEEFAINSYKTNWESTSEQQYRLFRDVVNAFSPNQSAHGSNSGFEATIANPLAEFGDSGADVLLAMSAPTGVHLCFVSCRVSGERYEEWRQEVARTEALIQPDDHREELKRQIECSDLRIRTVQHLTLTRAEDVFDIDMDVMRTGTPNFYAIWELIESVVPPEVGDEGSDEEVERTIRHREGHIEHSDLADIGREGIDTMGAVNYDLKYCLNTHPIIPIGEVCLGIYLDNTGKEEPKEFFEGAFEEEYREHVYFGEDRDGLDDIIDTKTGNLLDTALEYGIVTDNPDDLKEREYRIQWESDEAGDIKKMVKRKFFKSKAPQEMGELAFQRAVDEFDSDQLGFGDFD
ncbi:hypothetical protein [Halomarina rubra]|uniref:Uncharacterized protein n=1 Tax=Halomarina rubra TaxID=2071873 RepID=A0ABD6AS35_9EURY|nr:hypothetical protein [Halomarina rubra]